MDILLRYGANTKLTDSEVYDITTLTKEHGNLHTEEWWTRSGAIDIVTYLEIIFGSSIFRAITKPIIEGYFKGLIDEDYFKGVGKLHKKFIQSDIEYLKNYLVAFYKVFISKKQEDRDAIAIIENIEDVTLYAILNAYKSNLYLTESLAEAIVKTYALVTLKLIDIQEPKIIQLYPDFNKNTWDYLFIPSTNAFGKFIDRYYSFSRNEIFTIETIEGFISIFEVQDLDEYKYLINPKLYS